VKKISSPYYFIVAFACILWLPSLLEKGMFMDGVFNALFAHNLAHGISTFWAPQTIYYSTPAYWDNPPLSMFTLATCYKIFGDYFFVERIYSVTCAIIQLILLMVLWRTYFKHNKSLRAYAWLPAALWLFSPLTSWGFANNMMENTMSIFTSAAVIVFVHYCQGRKSIWLHAIIGGALIFLAVITKGPTGLFPLAIPLFFVFAPQKSALKNLVLYGLLQFIFFAAMFAIVFAQQAPHQFLQHYLEVQLKPTLNHKTGGLYVPYAILPQLIIALSPLAVITALLLLLTKPGKVKAAMLKDGLSFFCIGLSASLPIALSVKQNKHYLIPSIPMFAMAVALVALPYAVFITGKITAELKSNLQKFMKVASALTMVICVFLCIKNAWHYNRDKELLTDIEAIQPFIKNEKVIKADWPFFGEWSLRAYLNRFYDKKICMPNEAAPSNFYLALPGGRGEGLAPNAQKIYAGKTFDLYKDGD
jgi:hypothetical protein